MFIIKWSLGSSSASYLGKETAFWSSVYQLGRAFMQLRPSVLEKMICWFEPLTLAYLTWESNFGAVFECSPSIVWWTESRHELPRVGIILTEQSVEFAVPYQFHSAIEKRGTLNTLKTNFIKVLRNVFYMCYTTKEYLFNFKEMSVKIYRTINFAKRIKKNLLKFLWRTTRVGFLSTIFNDMYKLSLVLFDMRSSKACALYFVTVWPGRIRVSLGISRDYSWFIAG